jgi:Flp pilus assembly pilin Flp
MKSIDQSRPHFRGWRRFLLANEGSTAVEYAVMMALIAAVGLASV